MRTPPPYPLGISAIAVSRPGWRLDNAWFGASMPRKFSHHTGIESREVSEESEETMAAEAVRRLQRDSGCDPASCRALLLVSPSLLPPTVAREHLAPEAAARERAGAMARRVALAAGLRRARTAGINWFCCGYSRALELLTLRWAPRLGLREEEHAIVVVATRISRITDYQSPQTAGLFGDMATATLVAPVASRRHPVHFEIVHAAAARQPCERPAFGFRRNPRVTVPSRDGGPPLVEDRVVFTLDGMAIADLAPRAMAEAVAEALAARGLRSSEVDAVVPHQAGTGIVRFTSMQLEGIGVRCEVVNGLTRDTGNVSACSVPHALREHWSRLHGLVACPTAAVGSPGRAEVLRGCVLLRSTARHAMPAAA